jgi:hypothetical protein
LENAKGEKTWKMQKAFPGLKKSWKKHISIAGSGKYLFSLLLFSLFQRFSLCIAPRLGVQIKNVEFVCVRVPIL